MIKYSSQFGNGTKKGAREKIGARAPFELALLPTGMKGRRVGEGGTKERPVCGV